jgi:hypothetical protein
MSNELVAAALTLVAVVAVSALIGTAFGHSMLDAETATRAAGTGVRPNGIRDPLSSQPAEAA